MANAALASEQRALVTRGLLELFDLGGCDRIFLRLLVYTRMGIDHWGSNLSSLTSVDSVRI